MIKIHIGEKRLIWIGSWNIVQWKVSHIISFVVPVYEGKWGVQQVCYREDVETNHGQFSTRVEADLTQSWVL